MLEANRGQAPQELNGQGLAVGIVQARFNAHITDALAAACTQQLQALGVSAVSHVQVPGALEVAERSEERRVGKECRSRWSPYH